MSQIGKGLKYLKSIPAILKIVEFVIFLIAIGFVGYFLDKAEDDIPFFSEFGKKGNVQFFLFVVIVGWLLVMALFSLFITGLHEKVSQVNWTLTVAIVSALWAVPLLISSVLVADAARHYDDKKVESEIGMIDACKLLDKGNFDAQCGHLIGGAIFGFIATVLHAVDAAVHVRMFLSGGSAPPASAPGTVSS